MANMIDIIVNATDNASVHIERINRQLDLMGDRGGKVTAIMTGLTGSIAGLAPATAGVMALASTLASAGVGAVAFGAVAVSSISKVVEKGKEIEKLEEKIAQADSAKERIKYQKQLAQVMAGVSQAEKGALDSLNQFKSWWGGFTSQFDPQVFGVMSQGLDLVRNTMTALTPAITSVGNVLNDFLAKINNGFQSESAKRFFDYINTSAGSNLEAVLTTAGNFFMGFFEILKAFQPLSEQFNGGMVKMSENFLKWSEGLAGSKSFQNFVDYAVANTPVFLGLIGDLWGFLVKLVQALAPLGSAILKVAGAFVEWLNTSGAVKTGLDLIKQAGEFLLDNLDALKIVLGLVVGGFMAFKTIVFVVSIVKTMIATFKALKTAFTVVRTAIMGMNTAFLMSPVTWVIAGIVALIAIGYLLYQNWDLIKAKALELWNYMKQVWEGIKTTVVTAFNNLITAVTTWATNMWTKITNMWESIKTAFSNGVTATIEFFKALPMNIINGLIYMVGFAIGFIIGFWIEVGLAFWNGILAVINFFKELPKNIMNLLKSLKTWFIDTVTSLWTSAKNLFKAGIDAVVNFFSKLPSRVMTFVTNLATNAVSKFKDFMNRAKEAVSTGIQNVVKFFSELPSKVMKFITDLASKLVKGFNDMMKNAKDAVKKGVENAVNVIKGFKDSFLKAGKGLLDAFTDGVKKGIGKAKKAVEDGMSAIRDFLPFSPAKKGALSDLDKSGESFFPTWYEGALKKVPAMTRAIGGAMGSLNDEFGSGMGIAQFTGGRTRMTVTHRHEHTGAVQVQGDSGKETLTMVGESMRTTTENDVFKNLRQAVRQR